MDKTKMAYFKDEDILHIVISEEKEADSIELSPNITAELNESGELTVIEILEASSFLRDSILESSQDKILKLKKPYNNQIQRTAKNAAADLSRSSRPREVGRNGTQLSQQRVTPAAGEHAVGAEGTSSLSSSALR